MRRLAAVLAVGLALTLSGCGSSGGSKTPAHAEVKLATLGNLGKVLVDSHGGTLYMFAPDARHTVTCTGACAGTWPPLLSTGAPAAGSGVDPALLGVDSDPDGGQVVTYGGWPLYTYVADVQAGLATGQALDLNGGLWYVMTADGKPLLPPGSPPLAGS